MPSLDGVGRLLAVFGEVLAACSNEQTRTVKHELTDIFRRYGLPWQMADG